MPVGTMREASGLTAQTLADFALQADQRRRAALKAGDLWAAVFEAAEVARLAKLSRTVTLP